MRKFWLVFWYEYRYHVLRWRFLGTLLSLPLSLLLMLVVGGIMFWTTYDRSPVGIVDQAGFFKNSLPESRGIPLLQAQFQLYPSETAARSALDAGEVKVFYVFPPDFQQNRQIDVFYTRAPEVTVTSQVKSMVLSQYMHGYSTEHSDLLAGGTTIIPRTVPSSTGKTNQAQPVSTLALTRMAIPFAAIFLVAMGLTSSAGYLSQAIADEKANRTIEILVTSLSPEQLMTGKITALVSVGLTQLLFWGSGPALLLGLAMAYGVNFDRLYPGGIGVLSALLSMALPTLLLYSALVVMVTIAFADPQEGQQFSGLVFLLNFVPMLLINIFMVHPDGAISLILSFVPFFSMTALMLRSVFTTLPAWQIAFGWVSLLVGLWVTYWLTGRVFRASMLRFGKPLIGWGLFVALYKGLRNMAREIRAAVRRQKELSRHA